MSNEATSSDDALIWEDVQVHESGGHRNGNGGRGNYGASSSASSE